MMDVFALRNRLVADYRSYTRSFIKIADQRISEMVDNNLDAGAFWPEQLLQLNPMFKTKRVILEIYDEMAEAIRTGQAIPTRPASILQQPIHAAAISQGKTD